MPWPSLHERTREGARTVPRMGLEHDVRKLIYDAAMSVEMVRLAEISREDETATTDDLFQVVLAKQTAIEEGLALLAREIDRIRADG